MSQIQSKTIVYQSAGQEFAGALVFNPEQKQAAPGLIMAPNWMGVTENAIKLAEKAVAQGYVVLVVDLLGKGRRPENTDQAGVMMDEVKNTPFEVERMSQALKTLIEQQEAPVLADKVAAFGFCFGGHNVLELARSGADIKAAISFHGGLDTCGKYDAAAIKCPVLVLDGARDPVVPREQLPAFVSEMAAAQVDWHLISYHDAVHSFTDPNANVSGVSEYNARVTELAFDEMFTLLKKVF